MATSPRDPGDGTRLGAARRLARVFGADGRVHIAQERADDSAPPATALLDRPGRVAEATEPVDPRVGLILRFDDPEVQDRGDGRRQRTLRGWSVSDLAALGADAVWLTVWWHPEADRPIRHGQEKFVEIVGHDADHQRLPLVLEPAVDPRPTGGDSTPERVLAIERHAIGRFADERYRAALIAVPRPSDDVVAGTTTDVLRRHFAQIDDLVGVPWILSIGDESIDRCPELVGLAMSLGAVGTAVTST